MGWGLGSHLISISIQPASRQQHAAVLRGRVLGCVAVAVLGALHWVCFALLALCAFGLTLNHVAYFWALSGFFCCPHQKKKHPPYRT